MAITHDVYGPSLGHLFDADIDWVADTIKLMLCTSAYTPDLDAHDFRNDITNEVAGTGYTAGGVTLASKSATADTGTDSWIFDCDDPEWGPAATIAGIRYGVTYKSRGGASSADELVSLINFDGDQAVTAGTFKVQVNAAGFLVATRT